MSKNYYMVRAMDSTEENFRVLLENNVVAIGWSDVDFTKYKQGEFNLLREAVEEKHYKGPDNNFSASSLGRKYAAIRRFINISKGDIVVVPYPGAILLAKVTGNHLYDEKSRPADLANQIEVEYKKGGDNKPLKILRSELTEILQRRLRTPGSIVLDFNEFGAEIDRLFEENYKSFNVKYADQEVEKIEKFKKDLLTNIQKGSIYIKGGGMGLEELVRELLSCEGYSSPEIPSKRSLPAGADIDIRATKKDTFLGDPVYIFQVKHHEGITDEKGVQQLIEAAKYRDVDSAHRILITTGELSDKAKKLADEHGIVYMDGHLFVDWIYDNINKLSQVTRAALQISTVPQITI